MTKPIVYYTETNPIIVGQVAYIIAHNHPRNPNEDKWPARTSTVLAYDIITGEIETLNTIYKVKVKIKSVSKTDHKTALETIQPDNWTRAVPLTDGQVTAYSDGVKADLTELAYTFKYITCDKCEINKTCTFAFNLYNTDGDCLLK